MPLRACFAFLRPSARPLLFFACVSAACAPPSAPPPDAGARHDSDPKVSLPASPPADDAARARFETERTATLSMTADDFETRYALPFRDALPYAPLAAADLKSIESKRHPLTDEERTRLARDGFVLLPSNPSPTFALDYVDAFRRHLPVFISADAILYAMHKSFDALLKAIEGDVLVRDLGLVIGTMRDSLKSGKLARVSPETRSDIDDYLAVADALLEGKTPETLLPGHEYDVKALVAQATAGKGAARVPLFGRPRVIDFSQLEPRGHYRDSPALEQYFRAMMWLSRTDFRIVDVASDGSQVFRRRQLEGALALRDAMDPKALAAWSRLDRVMGAFVGEPDDVNLRGLDALVHALGIASASELARKSDDAIVAALATTGLGHPRIASQWMDRGPDAKGPLPLPTAFALMNQRYTLDAHVLSSVVFDRVHARAGAPQRMMPNPLDVAFAALGNDGASVLLRGELDRYGYAPELHMMRFLASTQEDDARASLYTTWSDALRALSPTKDALREPQKGGLPAVASTRVWNTRILNTQLASWAELRHDTVLYAKQSYTAGLACEFPDAYVDPYPEFFERVAGHARAGKALTNDVLGESPHVAAAALAYFTKLEEVATQLGQMATQEREGKPFTKAQMQFVNEMITVHPVGCGTLDFSGWYGGLFVDRNAITEIKPAIADVHTQVTDESGNPVGRVLHVAAGFTNPIVVTVESCHGPHAYVGAVSSYYERTTDHFERMDDAAWLAALYHAPRPTRPSWAQPIAPTR